MRARVTVHDLLSPAGKSLASYIRDLERRVKRAWFSSRQHGRATVVFDLPKSGEICNMRVESSSGNAAFDQASVDALWNASPFPTLQGSSREDVRFKVDFDYTDKSTGK